MTEVYEDDHCCRCGVELRENEFHGSQVDGYECDSCAGKSSQKIIEKGMNCGVKAEKAKVLGRGAVRSDSSGKGRFDLISPFGLKRLALRYEGGAIHKGERNFEKGFPISRCIESAMRHINEHNEGDREEDHMAAAAWQLFIVMHFEEMIERGILPEELDNQPRYERR